MIDWQHVAPAMRELARIVAVAPVAIPLLAQNRLRDHGFLQSPQRTLILDVIKSKPGIPVGELLERVPFGGGTLYHHLGKLAAAGAIYICTSGRRRLVYPANQRVPPEAVAAASMLRGRTARRIAIAIVERPHRSVAEISDEIRESQRVVYYHVQRFARAALIERMQGDGQRDLVPRPALQAAVHALAPDEAAFDDDLPEGEDGGPADRLS